MHQPYYKDNLTNEVSLPWVRLHGIKDYLDMVKILEDFPNVHQTFNFVPSLLEQIEDYNKGNEDKFLKISRKKSADLNDQEKVFILLNFFMANWDTMVKPYSRYYDLLEKRGKFIAPGPMDKIIKRFKEQDFLDLVVWFNLSWFDPIYKEKDEALKNIVKKGTYFSEEEKNVVLDKQLEILKQIIPYYKKAQENGQIEITTTPYYHPILPLLCNQEAAKEALPDLHLPKNKFKHPEDAQKQLELAVQNYQHNFGLKPRGLWPAEGSVSEEIVPLLIKNGINWIATDEGILFRSIHKERLENLLYKPYQLKREEGIANIIFRDRILSDLIGFVYSNWPAEAAVNDFIKRLYEIKQRLKTKEENFLVSIILDGENAWEYYSNDGRDFLLGLYQKLNEGKNFKLVTVSEFLKESPPKDNIEKLFAGSWINTNFAIWIGHEEKNTAWDYLSLARQDLAEFEQRNPQKREAIEKAWQEIYIAEGSDWNWWYGPDHSSGNDEEFDRLFRKHLANVYTLLGDKIPGYLEQPIKVKDLIHQVEPTGLIKPIIDGKDTNYYEWLGAGYFDAAKTGGTMHQSQSLINRIWYGFDLKTIYLRVDFNPQDSPSYPLKEGANPQDSPSYPINPKGVAPPIPLKEGAKEGTNPLFNNNDNHKDLLLTFDFGGLNLKLEVLLFAGELKAKLLSKESEDKWQMVKEVNTLVFDKILEIALNLSDFKVKEKEIINFFVTLESQDFVLERCPLRGSIQIKIPTADYESYSWSA